MSDTNANTNMSDRTNPDHPPSNPKKVAGKAPVLRAWKCMNCVLKSGIEGGNDFDALDPVCPKCGADRRKNPSAVVVRQIIHYDPPTDVVWKGENVIACNRAKKINEQGIRATGDYRLVSCEKCKESPEWQEATLKAEDLGNVVDVSNHGHPQS